MRGDPKHNGKKKCTPPQLPLLNNNNSSTEKSPPPLVANKMVREIKNGVNTSCQGLYIGRRVGILVSIGRSYSIYHKVYYGQPWQLQNNIINILLFFISNIHTTCRPEHGLAQCAYIQRYLAKSEVPIIIIVYNTRLYQHKLSKTMLM